MSTFRHRFAVVLDGVKYEVSTTAEDHLTAERQIAGRGGKLEDSPIALQMRVMFVCFSRTYPEQSPARNWQGFLGVLDEIEDLEPDTEQPLNPTREADLESLP
jgi:hypothetical protein